MLGPDFDHFCRLVQDASGLQLGPEKAYLVRGRLNALALAEGAADAPALLARLRAGAEPRLIEKCIHALATHETSFFRDSAPFEALKTQILPKLIAGRARERRLRIWCAACSAGQEPYSVAMILREIPELRSGWRIEILGTDFSEPILTKAQAGLYSDFEVRRGLSAERLSRWFQAEDGGHWRISPELRAMVEFRKHNILQGPVGLGLFDIILCRNVLIYFDAGRKQTALLGLQKALAPDGALFLGSAETILGFDCGLEAVPGGRGLCRRAGAASERKAG